MCKILNKYRTTPEQCDAVERAIAHMKLNYQKINTRQSMVQHKVRQDKICQRLLAIMRKYNKEPARNSDELFAKFNDPNYHKYRAAFKLYSARRAKLQYKILKNKNIKTCQALQDAGNARRLSYTLIQGRART